MNKIDVIVLTYNSQWEKLNQTIDSVINQKNVEINLVFADDGSKIKNTEKIKNYLQSKSFNNFIIQDNQDNKGTVQNILSGLQHCKNKYVKLISPGDYFCADDLLYKFFEFEKDNEATVYFGKPVFYSNENNNFVVYKNKANPIDLRPYIKNDIKKIKHNYFIKADYICGATTIYDTKIFTKYLTELSSELKFCEDMSIIYMLSCGEKIQYLSNINDFIYYECDSGISISKNTKWNNIMLNDNRFVYNKAVEDGQLSNFIYNWQFNKNKIIRIFYKFVMNPKMFWCKLLKKHPKLKGWE